MVYRTFGRGSKNSFCTGTLLFQLGPVYYSAGKYGSEKQEELKKKEIPTMIYYPFALHQQIPYQGMGQGDTEFPATMHAVQTVLSLPIHPYMKKEEVDLVAKLILENL